MRQWIAFAAALMTFALMATTKAQDSCAGHCGDAYDATQPCQCNTACTNHGDCCDDYSSVCATCVGLCDAPYDSSLVCQCNSACESHNDCCPDYSSVCGGGDITDQDLQAVGQQIWDADVNRATVSLNLQGKISDGSTSDAAPKPLFNSIPDIVYTNPLYTTLRALFDDYTADDSKPESITSGEDAEIDAFLSEAMKTQCILIARDFLAQHGKVPSDDAGFQEVLKTIWYLLYQRSGALSSSGAEHVQVGELKDGDISGLHNWVRFALLEEAGEINYLGYVDYLDFGGTSVIRNPFYWNQAYKPIGGFFIGTSPAFDLAVYTLCYYSRPNVNCPLTFNGFDVPIQTYTIDCDAGECVGSSYPNF